MFHDAAVRMYSTLSNAVTRQYFANNLDLWKSGFGIVIDVGPWDRIILETLASLVYEDCAKLVVSYYRCLEGTNGLRNIIAAARAARLV